MDEINVWCTTKDGDPAAFEIMRRHYTYHDYADGRRHNTSNPVRKLFAGPGQKMILVTQVYDALFVWRKFIDDSGQTGVNCAVFRNESSHLSSDLIRMAEQLAWLRWPGARLYTYVNASKVQSINPGYCFKRAGWKTCGKTKARGLVILERTPDGMD